MHLHAVCVLCTCVYVRGTSFLTTPILLLLLSALQGAFNIAYVGVAWFTKQPRPYHLCTPDVQRAWEKLQERSPASRSAPAFSLPLPTLVCIGLKPVRQIVLIGLQLNARVPQAVRPLA